MQELVKRLEYAKINIVNLLENNEPTNYFWIKFCKKLDMYKFIDIVFNNLSVKTLERIKGSGKNSWKIEISIWDEIYQNGKLDLDNSPITFQIPKTDQSWILVKFA